MGKCTLWWEWRVYGTEWRTLSTHPFKSPKFKCPNIGLLYNMKTDFGGHLDSRSQQSKISINSYQKLQRPIIIIYSTLSTSSMSTSAQQAATSCKVSNNLVYGSKAIKRILGINAERSWQNDSCMLILSNSKIKVYMCLRVVGDISLY